MIEMSWLFYSCFYKNYFNLFLYVVDKIKTDVLCWPRKKILHMFLKLIFTTFKKIVILYFKNSCSFKAKLIHYHIFAIYWRICLIQLTNSIMRLRSELCCFVLLVSLLLISFAEQIVCLIFKYFFTKQVYFRQKFELGQNANAFY